MGGWTRFPLYFDLVGTFRVYVLFALSTCFFYRCVILALETVVIVSVKLYKVRVWECQNF